MPTSHGITNHLGLVQYCSLMLTSDASHIRLKKAAFYLFEGGESTAGMISEQEMEFQLYRDRLQVIEERLLAKVRDTEIY